jgi:hypothetical protein
MELKFGNFQICLGMQATVNISPPHCSQFAALGIHETLSLQFLNPKTVGRAPWSWDQPDARLLPT